MLRSLIRNETALGFQVRFHTETGVVRELLCDHPDVSVLLSYGPAQPIYRGTYYYILRACFDALRFPGVSSFGEARHAVPLHELQHVATALTTNMADVRLVERIRVGDRTLTEVIADLESLSFLENVLTRYVPDNLVRSLVQDLDTAFAVREESVRAEIQAEIQSIAAQLRSETERIRAFMSFMSEIRARVTQMRRSPSEFRISDPDRDLAAVRWGAELTDADRALMADLLNPVLSQLDETDVVRTCAEIVKISSAATDEGRSIAISVVLWALGLFDRVVEVVNRFDRSQLQLPISLELLRTGARLRSGLPMSQAEIDALLAGLLHRVESEAPRLQGRWLLGLGYLALLATHSDERWLTKSLELSRRALDSFRDDVLGRAFAIHQCAHVAILSGSSLADAFIHSLRALRTESVWNYRFADTLALYHLRKAEREWECESSRSTVNDARSCAHLRIAAELLHTAPSYDMDIEMNRHKIQRLRAIIGCDA
jgi:hypothetical protein